MVSDAGQGNYKVKCLLPRTEECERLFRWQEILSGGVALPSLYYYLLWFSGYWTIGWQIIGNIAILIPIGILLSDYKHFLAVDFIISITIELLQLVTLRGLFEFDDILNNTIGALIGHIVVKKIDKRWIPWLGALAVLTVDSELRRPLARSFKATVTEK